MATLMINKIKSNETISIPLKTTKPNSACMAFIYGNTTYYAQLVPQGDVFDSGIHVIRAPGGQSNPTQYSFALSTNTFNVISHNYYGSDSFSFNGSYTIEKPEISPTQTYVCYLSVRLNGLYWYKSSINAKPMTLKGNATTGAQEGFLLITTLRFTDKHSGYYMDIGEWYCSSSAYIRIRKNKKDYIELVVNGSVVCTSKETISTEFENYLIVSALNNECYIELRGTKSSVVKKKFSAGDYTFYFGKSQVTDNLSYYDLTGQKIYKQLYLRYCSEGQWAKPTQINLRYT